MTKTNSKYFYLMKLNLIFLFYKSQACLFVLAGLKNKFAHDVAGVCIMDNWKNVMRRYDNIIDIGVVSIGFNENNYHAEYYRDDGHVKVESDKLNENVIPYYKFSTDKANWGFSCEYNDQDDCQLMCDAGYNQCLRWFNDQVQ